MVRPVRLKLTTVVRVCVAGKPQGSGTGSATSANPSDREPQASRSPAAQWRTGEVQLLHPDHLGETASRQCPPDGAREHVHPTLHGSAPCGGGTPRRGDSTRRPAPCMPESATTCRAQVHPPTDAEGGRSPSGRPRIPGRAAAERSGGTAMRRVAPCSTKRVPGTSSGKSASGQHQFPNTLKGCPNSCLAGGATTAWWAPKPRQGALSPMRSDVPHNHRLRRVPVYSEQRP
jgi:hypothetical protein